MIRLLKAERESIGYGAYSAGRIVAADFQDRGSAIAALIVERRRLEAKAWKKP